MEPNPHTQWRLAFAREIAERLRRYHGIRAIVVGGSVARGYADAYSDLELPLVWDELPADELRLQIAADLGAEFLYPYNGPACEDNLLINGLQVDLWHATARHEEQVIERVLRGYSLDPGDSNFMDTLRHCIPLHGAELIEAWRARSREYPDELAVRHIQRAVSALEATHLSILAYRDNPTLLYGQISEIQKQVFLILLALNRRYFPTYKWIYPVLAEMAVKPPDAAARFRQAYTAAPAEAAAITARLVEETLRLVQTQFPQVDTSPVRSQLRMTRTKHDEPVRFMPGQ